MSARSWGARPTPPSGRRAAPLLVTETDEEARQYLRREDNAFRWYFEYIIGVTSAGGFVHMLKSDPDMPDEEVTPEYCIDTIVTAGSPKTVAKKIAEFRRRDRPVRDPDRLAPRLGPQRPVAAPHGAHRDRAHAAASCGDRLAGGGRSSRACRQRPWIGLGLFGDDFDELTGLHALARTQAVQHHEPLRAELVERHAGRERFHRIAGPRRPRQRAA